MHAPMTRFPPYTAAEHARDRQRIRRAALLALLIGSGVMLLGVVRLATLPPQPEFASEDWYERSRARGEQQFSAIGLLMMGGFICGLAALGTQSMSAGRFARYKAYEMAPANRMVAAAYAEGVASGWTGSGMPPGSGPPAVLPCPRCAYLTPAAGRFCGACGLVLMSTLTVP